MIEQDKNPFKMSLTLFGDGPTDPPEPTYSAVEGDIRGMLGEPAPVEPGVPPAEPPVVSPEPAPVEPGAEPTEPATPPAEPQPVPAPANNDLMAHPVVQELMNVVRQQQEAIKQQSEMMQNYIQNTMTNNAPQPSPVVTKTPEEMEAEKEQWLNSFYEKGPAAIEEIVSNAIKVATEPLNQKLSAYESKEAWNTAIAEMAGNKQGFPEFENVRARMGEILKERPYLMQSGDRSKALADAYALAMAERGQAQTAAAPVQVNPADMMKNPEFIKQIIGNPEVMKMIAAEQAKMIQDNSQQVPPMSPSSGVANVAPFIKNSPQDYNELESDIKNSLHRGLL